MSASAPDPVIHNPQRLRIVATLAALRDGDTLSASRLQAMIGERLGGRATASPRPLVASVLQEEASGPQASGSRLPSTAACATSVRRRLRLRA